MSQRLLLLVVVAFVFLWATRRWQRAAFAAMVLLVFEGAIRKWLFPGSQQLVYFAKDVLLIGCYLGYWRDQGYRRYRIPASPVLMALLTLAAAWAALEIFNPSLPNLLVGIAGFKAYFLYVPLMFVLPACFEDDQQLKRFLSSYALLAIPVGALALLQFASPASSSLNTYARRDAESGYVATFGSSEHVRVTGTFSFITGYTSFLVAIAILLLALLGSTGWRLRGHRKLYLALALTVLGMFMSGSRGPVFLLAILFPFYWYLAVLRERDTGGTFTRGVLGLGIVAAAVAATGGEAFNAFLGRAASSTDVASRFSSPWLSPYLLLPEAGFFGFGTGSTHQMATALAPSIVPYSWLHGLMAEVETGKIMLELGPVGFVLIYASRLVLLGVAFGHAHRLRTRFHRAVATAAFLFFLAQLFGSPVFDVTSGVYYWFFAGVLMLAVRLDAVPARAKVAATGMPTKPSPLHPVAARLRPRPVTPAWRASSRGY